MRYTLIALGLIAVGFVPCHAQTLTQRLQAESASSIAQAAMRNGNPANGAVLFADQKLGCANCHAAGRTDLLGPDLSRLGKDATPQSIVEAVLDPSKTIRKGYETVTVVTDEGKAITGRVMEDTDTLLVVRDISEERRLQRVEKDSIDQRKTNSVSSMPTGLADKLTSRQQFLDLTRYVIEVVAAGPMADRSVQVRGGGAVRPHLRGIGLLNELNCVSCHQLDVANVGLTPAKGPNLAWVSGRVSPTWLENYISDPHAMKPGSRMPDVLGSLSNAERKIAAKELTHYIASLSDRKFAKSNSVVDKATSPEAQARTPDKSAPNGRDLFHSVGCAACHSPRDEQHTELIPDSVPLGKIGSKYSISSLTEFLKNPHTARPAGLMPDMLLTHWEAIDVASYLLSDGTKPQIDKFEPNSSLAAAGAKRFQRHGCMKCHEVAGHDDDAALIVVDRQNLSAGCLSGNTGTWPRYHLTDSDKVAIRSAIGPTGELTSEDHIDVHLTTRKCLNCHTRGELGGLTDDRDSYFLTENPNLGPQGRVPPTLTGVGAKLKPTWMRQVLVRGRRVRPYVKTRMPQYGADHVGPLVDMFQQADKQPELRDVKFAVEKKKMRDAGLELAGTRGLNCIVCHTFQMKPAATMPAVDLTEMSERLQKDWFRRYMRNPQQLSPNTVMPSFWPGGKAIRKEVLAGDPDQQVEALWQWLLDGRQARTPRGLIREPMELLATKTEAVMLRRAYPGIGKRGIGVGYPNKVNIAYDAEQMRLAMIWRGKFADPGGVWRSQGHGQVRPLSRPIQFAKGPDVWGAKNPWKPEDDRPKGHRFGGYWLDDYQRPKFFYGVGNFQVEDYCIDTIDRVSGKALIERRLKIRGAEPDQKILIRAASAKTLVDEGGGVFRLDNGLRVRISESFKVAIVDASDGQQLQITLHNARAAGYRVVIEYVW